MTKLLAIEAKMESGKHSQEFLNVIKSEFGYLFERYGFLPRVSSEGRQGEYCLAVLQWNQCQIKFRLEKGVPEYFFATLEASPDWTVENGWYDGDVICAYLFRRNPELTVVWPKGHRKWSTEETLRVFSARLRPVVDQIISAFDSNLTVDWWQDFIADRNERIRQMKDRIANRQKVGL
jgi:hypothetical protein